MSSLIQALAVEGSGLARYEELFGNPPLHNRQSYVDEESMSAERPQRSDLVLYLAEANEEKSEALLSKLISEHARPVFRSIIRSKLRVSLSPADTSQPNQDALEIESDVQLLLLSQLRVLKSRPETAGITNFISYVAATTYNACYKHLRRKYPLRSRLKNRLRYLLTHDAKFVFWQGPDREWLCGLAAWQNTDTMLVRVRPFRDQVDDFKQNVLFKPAATTPDRKTLAAVLEWAGAPVELDQLVTTIANIYDIKDEVNASDSDHDDRDSLQQLPDKRDLAAELEQRHYLRRLWSEICQLPLRQRLALLLNLRDANGRGVVALLPLTGVASIRQIAAVLEMEAKSLALLWNHLPLTDNAVGESIGATSQQVVNLRKCARERLARRMRAF